MSTLQSLMTRSADQGGFEVLPAPPTSLLIPTHLTQAKFRLFKLIACCAVLLMPAVARATIVTIGSDIEFSNGQAPASATRPWIQAKFNDHGGVGSVDFTLTASNLTASENVSELDMNIDPALTGDLTHLTFSGLVKGGSFDTPTISQGEDAFKADGDGKYDIMLSFTTGGTSPPTFTHVDSLKYTITGSGLTAASFHFLSTPAGGHGPFTMAAHIQNTTGVGAGGSGWVADSTGGVITNIVPEPSTAILALIGGLGMWLADLRRRRA